MTIAISILKNASVGIGGHRRKVAPEFFSVQPQLLDEAVKFSSLFTGSQVRLENTQMRRFRGGSSTGSSTSICAIKSTLFNVGLIIER